MQNTLKDTDKQPYIHMDMLSNLMVESILCWPSPETSKIVIPMYSQSQYVILILCYEKPKNVRIGS